VARHSFQECARPGLQALTGDGVQRPRRRGRVRGVDARRRECQVRVGVHETGHHHPSRGVDLDGVARLGQVLHPPAGSDFHQNAIPNEDGAVLDYVEFLE